ncbi:major facilitator superfamily domain-containing protein 2B isoform X1 [Syngnathus typhle]|uniref:major facilitator superfamily domain-containing protein 2B isoform X1 n=1 Tax=Syngnathus typhle TaxID=161592 RepID=UPI002A69F7C1|nr:major facilitator superfamily domain-containing protein 2B isoform X1 [Syngnathus typhle]XP_061125765.1 major facilitator superfamily domain-containing protein 2B isoform X1 [Syngnathus typhle]
MAAERVRVVQEEEQEEAVQSSLPARSQSHVQFPPRLLAHTRSLSHTQFGAPSQKKRTSRLTHSLSAMARGENGAQGGLAAAGKMLKPAEALLDAKIPQQTDLSQKLSVCNKLCFAIGGVPKEVAASATAFFLQIYLLDVAQINAFQASMVLFIGKAWGAVVDPVVGFFINKTKWTRIGRLMPWMLGSTPFLVVSYFYLWYVPPFVNGRFVWYLGFYCLYQTLITCYHVPYSALTMFLSTDQRERDSATAYRMTLEVLGTLAGAAIQGQIVASAHRLKHCQGHNNTTNALNNSGGAEVVRSLVRSEEYLSHAKEVYMIAAGVIGGIFLVCTVVMFLGVKEKDDPYAPRTEKQIPFHRGFIMVMRHGPYLILTAAFLFILVAIQLVQNNFVLFCTYAADLREHFQNIVLTILVSAVISIPLWQWFLQKFGKKTAAFCGITGIMPFTMMLVFIPNVVVAYVVAVSSGLSVAASLLLPWSMLPDVVDDFRLANPNCKGHEAIFYSFYVFFTKFAAAVSLGVSTLCLQFAGYENGACKQPVAVVYTLKLLIGAAPVAFIITGLMILLLYPITEEVRLRNKLHLDELRKQTTVSRSSDGLGVM